MITSEQIEKIKNYTCAAIIGAIVFFMLLKGCNQNKGQNRGDKIKMDTTYVIKEKVTHYNDTIVKIHYKDKYVPYKVIQNEIESKSDTGWVTLPYNDYHFKYDTIQEHKYGESKISIKGWGYVSKVEVNNKWKDTTITITKEIIKYNNASGLFLSAGYQRPFDKNSPLNPLYSIGLDYQIKNKVIIGTSIGVQNNEPVYGLKLGIKIK
jgi:hypothetical protein